MKTFKIELCPVTGKHAVFVRSIFRRWSEMRLIEPQFHVVKRALYDTRRQAIMAITKEYPRGQIL